VRGHHRLAAVPLTRALALLLAVALTAIGAGGPGASSTPQRPNVLVIMTDDQRVGTLSVMPSTREWFGRGGVTYPNAYATTPLCCPSRGSIFTGRYAHNHGVEGNADAGRLDHTQTIQRVLQDAGYRTGYTGKFLNRWNLAARPPFFDRSVVVEGGEHRAFPAAVNGEVRTVHAYATHYVEDQALRTLQRFERRDARPWLMVVAPTAPHEPFIVERAYAGFPVPPWTPSPAVRERDRSDKPPYVQASTFDLEDGRDVRRKQLRMLRSVDDLVAELRRTLADLRERNTIAFFLSDNGFHWGEHGLPAKAKPYTASVRIPLLVRWPGHLPRGASDPRMVANIDVAPTILEAAGLPSSLPVDGRSLLSDDARDRLLLEARPENSAIPDWASTRTPEYQYVEYYQVDGTVSFREYYDLMNDPWQLTNLYADSDPTNDPSVEETARLSAALARDRRCEGTPGPSACP
jgi:arylsulfatase A-like enzyme